MDVQHKTSALIEEEILRPPLVPSEINNAAPAARKPRTTREIASRYKTGITTATSSFSTATPRRFPSPIGNRAASMAGPSLHKRSQSAEKRRPSTPLSRSSAPSSPSRPSTPVRDTRAADMQFSSQRLAGGGRTPDGLWPSMRSLSSSFQSESNSVPFSKKDKLVANSNPTQDRTLVQSSANVASERKRSPLRGKNASFQSENSKPMEHLYASVKLPPPKSLTAAKLPVGSMTKSTVLTASKATSLSVSLRGVSPSRRTPPVSDGLGKGTREPTSEVMRRLSVGGSVRVEREMGSAINVSLNPSERALPVTRPSRTQSLPLPGSHRPSSPGKAFFQSTISTRSMVSPSRARPSTPVSSSSSAIGRAGNTSSVLSYGVDVRKGKKSINHLEDAHHLRLLYNRHLQWRFVNARTDAAMSIQKIVTMNILHTVWIAISELHDSVIMKRTNMQQSMQQMKLAIILKEQMTYLEDWALLEREHSTSLSGAIEALKASTLRLPVTEWARADVHEVNDAVSSAVDVMQAMGSSICYLLTRAEGANYLVSELSDVAAREIAMLDECRELLASTAAMQVQDSSLRTHILQLRQDVLK